MAHSLAAGLAGSQCREPDDQTLLVIGSIVENVATPVGALLAMGIQPPWWVRNRVSSRPMPYRKPTMNSSSRPPAKLPSTKLVRKPGETIWTAMARELVDRPDGPVALQVQSAVNAALRPHQRAVEGVVNALTRQLQAPGAPGVQVELDAAIVRWEAVCQKVLSEEVLAGMQREAAEAMERRRKQPPAMTLILQPGPHGLGSLAGRTDIAYALGLDLGGLQGTWHRLWAAISMTRHLSLPAGDDLIPTLRAEFEDLLGRPLTQGEWDALVLDAHWHCDYVMSPRFAQLSTGADDNAAP
ncbi:MAG: hypothetical protein JWR60_2691 [Polaromonas sp.]|nr:hypothetical protein [Polaromonas sp.]